VPAVPHLPAGVVTEVIIQKAHAVDFGAPIVSMLGLGGATVIEIGSANRCSESLMAASMRTPKAAVVYVVSHHVAGEDLVDLERAIALAHASKVPLILDAAAEVDLRRYVRLGADLVVYSGHKAIAGPTSGIICGGRSLVEACRAQGTGLGRMAKIGKEGLAGLIVALEQYDRREDQSTMLDERVAALGARLADEPGVRCERVLDPSRPIPRLRVFVLPKPGVSARTIVDRLAAASPSIRCRAHGVKSGFFEIDPRGLYDSQVVLVSDGIRAALRPGSPSQALPTFQ
jgi:D-glucosaminate-6-phosphate ammonia-lyase